MLLVALIITTHSCVCDRPQVFILGNHGMLLRWVVIVLMHHLGLLCFFLLLIMDVVPGLMLSLVMAGRLLVHLQLLSSHMWWLTIPA